mmetsp:Transcript_25580/g.39358  ORF Transcript_25580/g.39358 Transcript_25580/m.39358 type:complete len:126 (+) Transcript_25580:1100-1477(+)
MEPSPAHKDSHLKADDFHKNQNLTDVLNSIKSRHTKKRDFPKRLPAMVPQQVIGGIPIMRTTGTKYFVSGKPQKVGGQIIMNSRVEGKNYQGGAGFDSMNYEKGGRLSPDLKHSANNLTQASTND